MRKLLPLLLAIVGLLAGAGAGMLLRPPPLAETAAEESAPASATPAPADAHDTAQETEFVKLSNQFVVPVVEKGAVAAMVVLSLSIEVPKGEASRVYDREPRLRDSVLQTLFNHANAGGFRGDFTDPSRMADLRTALRETVRTVLAAIAKDVLITDIVRQDAAKL